jgi:hypothetical protein
VQIDTLALRMRPRAPLEAADLGVRLTQDSARSVYACYAVAYAPIVALAAASAEISGWLPTLVLFWAKPWLDRTILFVLARAAFGQPTSPRDLWSARTQVWLHQWWLVWTWRRLSPWRSLTGPVYQLEGLPLSRLRQRRNQIKRRKRGAGLIVTSAFATAETCLSLALASLLYWFAPVDEGLSVLAMLFDESSAVAEWVFFVSYAAVVAFLEPFYVGAGFALYLSRRAELEAWDVEQELRRAFAS